MKLGYYLKKFTTAWDNDWTSVSLGTSGTDLVAKGLYIEAGFFEHNRFGDGANWNTSISGHQV